MPILAASVEPQFVIVVTEFMNLGSLGAILRAYTQRREWLPASVMKNVGASILKGLCYLHSKDIIHRDLKPDNILLQGDLHTASVKIAGKSMPLHVYLSSFLP